MKNNRTTFVLVGVFFLSTLITTGLVFLYNRSMSKLADVNGKAQQVVGQGQALMQSLANDSLEYYKKNPDIGPTLQGLNWLPKPAAAPAAAPTARPTNK